MNTLYNNDCPLTGAERFSKWLREGYPENVSYDQRTGKYVVKFEVNSFEDALSVNQKQLDLN